jgi:hypothetical protein
LRGILRCPLCGCKCTGAPIFAAETTNVSRGRAAMDRPSPQRSSRGSFGSTWFDCS